MASLFNINVYIYHLPVVERRQLCIILDLNNKWEELAGLFMKYDFTTISMLRQEIQRGKSPTDELLTLWGHQNHTVSELFLLLSRMKHYQAMTTIKKFVDSKLHRLIDENYIEKLEKPHRNHLEDNQIPTNNWNDVENKLLQDKNVEQLLHPKAVAQNINYETKDYNESDKKQNLKPISPTAQNARRNSAISDVAESAGAIPQISYEELQKSTDNWNQANILGKGGFGTVFKGIWKCTQVAIKRIEQKENGRESQSEQIKQSITELYCLNAYRHDNILPLYGYSVGGPQPCLVYQYMSGGCLERKLRIRDNKHVLKWKTRLDIATGTARGLQYLHTIGDKPLIHGDIKSANILLDPNDVPRIGDFGLAREGPQSGYTHLTVSRIHGTMPYLPDEFLRGSKLSTKVDTYSFGIVLFEIATALGAYSTQRKYKFLKDHVVLHEGDVLELKDKRSEGDDGYFKCLIDIGKLCVTKRAKDRPEMVNVLLKLENVSA